MSPSPSDAHAGDHAAATDASKALASLRLSGLVSLLFLLLALTAAMLIPNFWPYWLTSRYVFMEDIWLLLVLCGAWALTMVAQRWVNQPLRPIGASRFSVFALGIALVGLCYAGHYLVLHGYDLTRDEQLVRFDAWIFQQGRLIWPIPPEWWVDADALTLRFMLPVEQPTAWASAYLPGNAALHALVGMFADEALTAPLLTGLSLPLVWSCARKIWPDDREAAAVSVILLACSGQFILTGMTAYAMASHLFFNLAWFRLYLADRRSTDLLALIVGWFATGLHQPVFHPMFVAPFMLLLLIERRWQRFGLFAAGYLAIGLFWLSYPIYQHGLVSGPMSTDISGIDYMTRLREVLTLKADNAWLMGANLLRLATWQHAALLPLVFAAWPMIRRDRLAGTLALGVIVPIAVMAIILPWQGPGFGYRYLHPVLGNVVLLGGFGWRALAPIHSHVRLALAVTSAATVALMLPLQLTYGHDRYAFNAKASAKIDASGADYVVLQTANGHSYGSVVFNHPDLSDRPIRLLAETTKDPQRLARRICNPGTTVAMATNSFFHPGATYFGVEPLDTADARLPALRAPYEAAGCRVVLLR